MGKDDWFWELTEEGGPTAEEMVAEMRRRFAIGQSLSRPTSHAKPSDVNEAEAEEEG